MRKGIMAFVLALLMVVTSLPITAKAATPQLVYRFAGCDSTGKHYEIASGQTQTSMNTHAGNGSPVTLYFIDENGNETRLSANDVTSSDSDILTFEADAEVPEVIHLRYRNVGIATLNYVHNNTTYSITFDVKLPMVGFYTSQTASAADWVSQYTVTDNSSNVLYLVSTVGDISGVTLNSELSQIATASKVNNTVYTVTISGDPSTNMWYGADVSVIDSDGQTQQYGASVELINQKSSLQFCWVDWNNNQPTPNSNMSSRINLAKGYSNDIYVYFMDQGTNKNTVTAGSLTSSNTNVVTVAANDQYPDMVCLNPVGFGTAKISYAHTNGQTYSFDVTVGLPDVGYYNSTTASQSSYITEYAVTDNSSNVFYMVANNGTMSNIKLRNGLDQIASVALDSSGKYATITITGTPENRWYDVEAEVTFADGRQGNNGVSIHLINQKSSLQFCWVDWNNNQPTPNANMSSRINLAKGYTNDIYVYFMEQGTNKNAVTAGSLTSSNTNVVTVAANDQYPDMVCLNPVGFGTAKISYTHTNGQTYSFDVTVGLPDVGYYNSTTVSQSSYITEFTVTDNGPNVIYLVANNGTMSNIKLRNGFEQIASVALDSSGAYATITITGTPENRWYDVEAEVTFADGRQGTHGTSINLINNKSSLMLRFPGFNGNGPEEDTNNSLENQFWVNKGQNEPAYFYFVSGGQENKLALEDLKSSDAQIMTVAVYEGSDAIVVEGRACGTADIQYTVNGITYSLPVVVRLPEIACYTGQTVTESAFVKEYTVTETANELYILPRDGQKIKAVNLLRDLYNIARVEIASDESYAKLIVDGNPDGQNYDYEVLMEETDGRQEYFYGNVTLYNGKPYIGLSWPDENAASGHGPIDTFLDTAVSYGTDVWVYLVDGGTERLLGISDLKSSDENIIKITDPGYTNGMVRLETVGWGTATVSYTSNGKTYSIDVVSDTQSFGYYTANAISRDNWIRGFNVTDDSNTFYFKADHGITFDELTPSQELKDVASIELSADKTYVKITVTGDPKEDCLYGFEFKFTHPNGGQGEGGDFLDFIKDLRTKVEVENLPVVDPTTPVTEVTVGVDQSTSVAALEETAKEVVDAVADGTAVTQVPAAVADSIKNALDNEAELKVTTSVYVDSLKKEEIQDEDVRDAIAAIEQKVSDEDGLIAQYLDLGVIMTTYVDGVEDASGEVTELAKPVVFTVALPEALKSVPEGYNRTVYVIYVHDGVVKSIPTTRNADGTVSFEASEFSTYALAYKDTKMSGSGQGNAQQNNQDNTQQDDEQQTAPQTPETSTTANASPNTADTNNIQALVWSVLISMAGIVLLLRKRRVA